MGSWISIKICPQWIYFAHTHFYTLTNLVFLGATPVLNLPCFACRIETVNRKLSCCGKLYYKRLAHSLPLRYFPSFCERAPTLVSAAEIDSERAILKKKDPPSGYDRTVLLSLSSLCFWTIYTPVFVYRNFILLYKNISLICTNRTQYDFSYYRLY